MEQLRLSRNQSSASSISRTLFTRTITRQDTANGSNSLEDPKGPLGLTTLFQPSDSAIADLIFVHGLGGGSRSTWSKSQDQSLFWPQKWLPQDAGFQDVRIHSFGYNANWDRESTLNIHDFAKSLLGSIQDCPTIPRGSVEPIILIGHSMGGLVIKKAYVIARQSQEFESLARRVSSVFFLATPHRGSDLAQLLTRVLHVTSGARPFVSDLHRNSLATQSINDEFPHHCQGLQLFSFYETLPTSYGVGKSLIVDKDLATLGYANERTGYLNADHRHVCKYSNLSDPNYLTVRNALSSTIATFRSQISSSRRNHGNEQLLLLSNYLDISDAPEDDFLSLDALRMRGSCEWLMMRNSFIQWRDSTETLIYWISAKPATGKSVLSGYIVGHIRDLNRDCFFYFFKHDNKMKSSIGYFLRSMAWQIAFMHPDIFRIVLEIFEKDNQLGKMDYLTIWRKLFLDGILRVQPDRPQYWVIDALDECKAESDLVSLLFKATERCPIRLLLTSRNQFNSYKKVVRPSTRVISEEILGDDTKSDIALYLEANLDHLPLLNVEAHQEMVSKILRKSAGCFLWVSLVLQELRQVHTSAEIERVIEDIPSDMDDLYSHVLDLMSKATYGKTLAKAILTWTVCSTRPLTTSELYHALQLDLKDTIDSVEKSIATSCNQLIYVDAQSRVNMVHQTARDFLLRPHTTSEFAIDRKSGHERLALTCLEYLNGNEMKGPRHRKLSVSNLVQEQCPFVNYACDSLYEHITHASSTSDDLLALLARFLSSSNVLSWIEYLARNANLICMIQTGKAIKNFLQRRNMHMSPLGKEVALLNSWATDLVRLATKFGTNLLASPSSIFDLIPPFCPSDSAPKKQFASSSRDIAVVGLSSLTWDDRISTISFRQDQLSALACSDRYFALGLSSGGIIVYHITTCQETRMVQQQEAVKFLVFGETGKSLVSAGWKAICVWDLITWQQIWRFDVGQQFLSFAFADNDRLLLGALKNNQLMFWDLTTGALRDSTDWTQDLEGRHAHAFRRPTTAAFGMEPNLLAIIYRDQDIILWDLERDTLHETFSKTSGASPQLGARISPTTVLSLVFSPAPGANLLAAAYTDGDLVLFDTSRGRIKETIVANAQTLAYSKDGCMLASGNSSGMIQLYEFESLRLLYRINSEEYGVSRLAFSVDGRRLLDIGESQCRIWDPPVLVRLEAEENLSDTVSISTGLQEIALDSTQNASLITALACSQSGDVFFCGKDNGSVCLYQTRSGRQSQELFLHAENVSILSLLYDDTSHILSSTDSSSRILTHQLIPQAKNWEVKERRFEHRAGVAVSQLLSNIGHTRMLVCSAGRDTLWSLTKDEGEIVQSIEWTDRGPHRWANHPLDQNLVLLLMANVAYVYEWRTLQHLSSAEGILLEGAIIPELAIRSVKPCFNGTVIATAFAQSTAAHSKSKVLLWNTADFTAQSTTAAPVPKYQQLADHVVYLIGSYAQRLLFLHSSGWVCSADSNTFDVDCYVRHFFIPGDWLSADCELMIEVSRKGDVIFVKRDEVAVIKRGLEVNERRSHQLTGKRPTLTVPSLSY